jgi:hypothetical protein
MLGEPDEVVDVGCGHSGGTGLGREAFVQFVGEASPVLVDVRNGLEARAGTIVRSQRLCERGRAGRFRPDDDDARREVDSRRLGEQSPSLRQPLPRGGAAHGDAPTFRVVEHVDGSQSIGEFGSVLLGAEDHIDGADPTAPQGGHRGLMVGHPGDLAVVVHRRVIEDAEDRHRSEVRGGRGHPGHSRIEPDGLDLGCHHQDHQVIRLPGRPLEKGDMSEVQGVELADDQARSGGHRPTV